MGQCAVVGEVVDRHDFDGFPAAGLRFDSTVEVASDAAETIDANPDSHGCLLKLLVRYAASLVAWLPGRAGNPVHSCGW